MPCVCRRRIVAMAAHVAIGAALGTHRTPQEKGADLMGHERTITVDLGNGQLIAVAAESSSGSALVADEDVVARLGRVADSVETVSRQFLDALTRISPKRAEVELTFGLAVEAGQLVALLGKAKGEASIRVLLEWTGEK